MLSKKLYRLLVVLIILGLVLTACGTSVQGTVTQTTAPAQSEIKRGGRLVFARQSIPINLDPVWTDSNYDIWLMQNIYEPLVRVNINGTGIEPALAVSWDISEDGKVYTFHLRPNVKFHDGSTLTASDVVWSLMRAANPDSGVWNWTLEIMEKAEAVDVSTVAITLKAPQADFMSLLAMFNASILPQKLVEQKGEKEFFMLPIGTGPFKVAEYVVADHILYEKNSNYWDLGKDGKPLPYLDSVLVKQVPEGSTRLLQVQSGDVDVTDEIPFSRIEDLNKDPNLSMNLIISTQSYYGWINHNNPPFDDVNVRLAMNYAIDRNALVKTVLFGNGQPATSFRPMSGVCFNASLEGFPYNLEKAKQLIAESKYPDGYKNVLVTIASGDTLTRDVGTVLKEMWAKIGIDIQLQEMETGAWYAEYDEDQFSMQLGGWTDDILDAQQQSEYMAVSPAGRTGWVNDRVHSLAESAAIELDITKRCAMYEEIQKIFNDEAVEILLFSTPFRDLLRKDVQGFNQISLGWFILRETWVNR